MVADRVDLIEQALQAQAKPTSLPRLVDAERYRKLLAMEPAAGGRRAALARHGRVARRPLFPRVLGVAKLRGAAAGGGRAGRLRLRRQIDEREARIVGARARGDVDRPAYDGPGLVRTSRWTARWKNRSPRIWAGR
jgi:hypothetical protein